jgi:hypothetical protein
VQEGRYLFMSLHVDDFLCVGVQSDIDMFVGELSTRYNIKHSLVTLCLGIQINRKPDGSIEFNQSHYINTSLVELGLQDIKIKFTPLARGTVKALLEEDSAKFQPLTAEKTKFYQQILGKMNYAAVCTRPDISFTVGLLGRFAAAPHSGHLAYAKHCMAYLKGTANASLQYSGRSSSLLLKSYVDSDHASTPGRKSTSGHCYFIGDSMISWFSQKQTTVALSTGEAEYIALCECTRETVWLRQLLSELGYPQSGPTVLHEDSQTCISYTKEDLHHKRSKHLDVKWHFTREKIQEGVVQVVKIDTQDQRADGLTKEQDKSRFELNCKQFRLKVL